MVFASTSVDRKIQKNLNKLPNTSLQEENHLKVLRLMEANPHMTQRDLANALGVSLGKTNYCIKALLEKGFIKIESFSKNPNKLAYAYLLTPAGFTEKTGLTVRFLERKIAEYKSLTQEIEALKSEVKKSNRTHD
jgi:EPS-associated MarR family transcriptional regulator